MRYPLGVYSLGSMAERQQSTGAAPTYIPALRWRSLTPAFDLVVRATTRERVFKPRLLDQANVVAGEAVLDVGAAATD